MRFATSGATRWLIAGLSARDTVEGCTPHFSATSFIVGRDDAANLAALPVTALFFGTIRSVVPSLQCPAAGIRPAGAPLTDGTKTLYAIDCNHLQPVIPHECRKRAQAASHSSRASRTALALGSGDSLARPHVGRFRTPDRFRPAAPLPAGSRPPGAEGLPVRRAVAVRRQQHPL